MTYLSLTISGFLGLIFCADLAQENTKFPPERMAELMAMR